MFSQFFFPTIILNQVFVFKTHTLLQKIIAMSENVPPQQQFYPDQQAIQHQHAQRLGRPDTRPVMHHPFSGMHPMVCTVWVLHNNVLTFFSCKLPGFQEGFNANAGPAGYHSQIEDVRMKFYYFSEKRFNLKWYYQRTAGHLRNFSKDVTNLSQVSCDVLPKSHY